MGKINRLATRPKPARGEKARLLLVTMLLLTGCNRRESVSDRLRNDEGPGAQAQIIRRPELANEAGAPHSAAPLPPHGSPPSPAMNTAPPSSETRYRAMGTEPFWAITVKGSNLTLERPDHAPLHLPIARTDDGRAIRYLGDGLAMVVTEGPCSDGMSDAVWADRVSVAFGEGTFKGCGGVREDF